MNESYRTRSVEIIIDKYPVFWEKFDCKRCKDCLHFCNQTNCKLANYIIERLNGVTFTFDKNAPKIQIPCSTDTNNLTDALRVVRRAIKMRNDKRYIER